MEEKKFHNSKLLRYGYTTGSCAAAAAKAAAQMLRTGQPVSQVRIVTPSGVPLTLDVLDPVLGEDSASCAIRKDGGDDPDATSGLLIYATVRPIPQGIRVDGLVQLVDDGFQLPVGFDVGRLPRETFKGNVIVSIAEWNLAVGGVFIVVPRRHCCLPAHVLKHFQIGNMEFHNVGFDHRCHEQHLFHSIPSFRIQCQMYYTPFHVLFQPQARKKAGQPARPFHISFSY